MVENQRLVPMHTLEVRGDSTGVSVGASTASGHSMPALPQHDEFSLARRVFEASCLVVAAALLVWQIARLAGSPGVFRWWLPLVVWGGFIAADWFSGMVHWLADTWGSETMPVLGRRFLRPFRVHHVNPDDFLRRAFLDTNGDVAMLVIPFLALTSFVPVDVTWGQVAAAFILAFCCAGLPTNQVHQWAHMRHPPAWVRRLQSWGIILSYAEHAKHHHAPYAMNYCIATGWCNRALTAIDFFPRLERLVTALTGQRPRSDDSAFQRELGFAARGDGRVES